MSIRGLYVIDRGNYNFSFQSFIKKPFEFMQGTENFIRWSGDPYDADINIQAVYEAENIQFNDLKEETKGSTALTGNTKNYIGPIWVVASLKDKLMHPSISFELQLPPKSELRNDINAQWTLDRINSDPGELNKQVAFFLYLIVLVLQVPVLLPFQQTTLQREFSFPVFQVIFQVL